MKLKNGEIYTAKDALGKLVAVPFPIKIGFEIAKMVGKLNEPYSNISIIKDELLKKYGDKKNGQLSIGPESKKWGAFIKDFDELMDQEIELEVEKVKLPEIDANIEPSVIIQLEKFIEL